MVDAVVLAALRFGLATCVGATPRGEGAQTLLGPVRVAKAAVGVEGLEEAHAVPDLGDVAARQRAEAVCGAADGGDALHEVEARAAFGREAHVTYAQEALAWHKIERERAVHVGVEQLQVQDAAAGAPVGGAVFGPRQGEVGA